MAQEAALGSMRDLAACTNGRNSQDAYGLFMPRGHCSELNGLHEAFLIASLLRTDWCLTHLREYSVRATKNSNLKPQ